MDPRRNNVHNGGSRMANARMQVMKTTSDISFSPTQVAPNIRKNQLNGLSRTLSGYQSGEKRSGLQNTTQSNRSKQPAYTYPKGSITEGVPSMAPQGQFNQQIGRGMPQQQPNYMQGSGGFSRMQQPQKNQLYQPDQQGAYITPQSYGQGQTQNQGHQQVSHGQHGQQMATQTTFPMVPNQDPYMQIQVPSQVFYNTQPQSAQNMGHFQQQQQFQAQQQQLAQHQQLMAQQNATIQAHQAHAQAQALAQMHASPQQQQVRAHEHTHHHHGRSHPAQHSMADNNQSYSQTHASVGGGDPNMCTTCPNCQTTIYIREKGADGYEFQNPYENVYGNGQRN